MTTRNIRLELEDGSVFSGVAFGQVASVAGEVVFNTGMVGYPETMTDPSYRGQILVMTYPLIGNYGVPEKRRDAFGLPVGFESEKIQIAALVVDEIAPNHSHYQAVRSLDAWMREEGVVGIAGVDTRALTIKLRTQGSMLGKIVADEDVPFFDPMATDLVAQVTCASPQRLGTWKDDQPTVVLVDSGCKTSIARSLLQRNLNVLQVPYEYYFLDEPFDGVFLSNGPGDPKMYTTTTRHVQAALAVGKPILGICLGHQLLSLAAGADTYKLKFGHRSQNQPCVEMEVRDGKAVPSRRCYITSQNHGYAVMPERLGPGWHVWFQNANDDTVEGVKHESRPFWGVQFHPEANPGPTDTDWIFDMFADAVRRGCQ